MENLKYKIDNGNVSNVYFKNLKERIFSGQDKDHNEIRSINVKTEDFLKKQ